MKDELGVQYYLRYTDDFLIIHHNPIELVSLLPMIRAFLREQLLLDLHPAKVVLRKLRQGIDFLGYVQLPHYRRLRTKTKRRMFKRLSLPDGFSFSRVQSYLGMLQHCKDRGLANRVRMMYSEVSHSGDRL